MRKPDPEKRCRHCGARMHRKRYGGRLEDLFVFLRRAYCDQRCMGDAKIRGDVSRSAHLWRARRKRKACCEECEGTDRLHVHHIDGDWRNDADENLRTLCASCHLEGHWAKPEGHFEPRRWVRAEPLDELLTVCEEIADQLTDGILSARLERAIRAVRNGHHLEFDMSRAVTLRHAEHI